MKKGIPSIYLNPRSETKFAKKEKADCSVRAMVAVSNKPYEDVHKFIKKYCDRKTGSGVRTSKLIELFDGKNKPYLTKHLGFRVWKETRYSTINQLIAAQPNRTYYVLVRHHATAVVHGKLVDMGCKNWHIQHCWEILKTE